MWSERASWTSVACQSFGMVVIPSAGAAATSHHHGEFPNVQYLRGCILAPPQPGLQVAEPDPPLAAAFWFMRGQIPGADTLHQGLGGIAGVRSRLGHSERAIICARCRGWGRRRQRIA